MKENNLSRRNFLTLTLGTTWGTTALAQPFFKQEGSVTNHNILTDPRIEGDELIVVSSAGLAGHRHEITIPLHVLQNPTEELFEFFSSQTAWHKHSIHLSSDQIHSIANGETVIASDSQWGEHQFQIYLPVAD